MKYIRKLPDAEELRIKYSLNTHQSLDRTNVVSEIKNILSGVSNKKILCIGPCSADNEVAVLDYMTRLLKLSEKVKDFFLLFQGFIQVNREQMA